MTNTSNGKTTSFENRMTMTDMDWKEYADIWLYDSFVLRGLMKTEGDKEGAMRIMTTKGQAPYGTAYSFTRRDHEGNTVYNININHIPEFLEQHPGHEDEALLRKLYDIEMERRHGPYWERDLAEGDLLPNQLPR